jgi:hypothetical protein
MDRLTENRTETAVLLKTDTDIVIRKKTKNSETRTKKTIFSMFFVMTYDCQVAKACICNLALVLVS